MLDIGCKKGGYAESFRFLHMKLVDISYKLYSINDLPYLPFLDKIFRSNKYLGVLWRQAFRLSPINIRPLWISKSIGNDSMSHILFAYAYLIIYEVECVEEYRIYAKKYLEEIKNKKSKKSENFSVRQGRKLYLKLYSADEESISPLLTAWAGRVFLKAYKVLGEEEYFDLSKSIARYFIDEHKRHINKDGVYYEYDPTIKKKIYNASAEISSFLYEIGVELRDDRALHMGLKGLQYIVGVQNVDGSWFYGEGRSGRYIDNYHTAFILYSILLSGAINEKSCIKNCLEKGHRYYIENLFKRSLKTLRPIHYVRSYLPTNSSIFQKVDIQDCAMSIIYLSSYDDGRGGAQVSYIWDWVNRRMCFNGLYCREITWLWKNRIKYIEAQSWMLLAMAMCAKNEK